MLETLIGGELPGEVESLFFCIQTGIGVGIIAFIMGRFEMCIRDRSRPAVPCTLHQAGRAEGGQLVFASVPEGNEAAL